MRNGARLGLLVIRSRDMDRLAEFYKAIGMQLEKHSHPPCGEHYSTIDDSCVFEICQTKQGEAPTTNVFFGLNVDDLDDTLTNVLSNNGQVIREPESSEWGTSAVVRDPEGHRVLLMQEKSSSVTRKTSVQETG